MKKILLLVILSPLLTEVKTDDQLWYGIQIDKSLKNLGIEISKENRLKDDYNNIHKSLTELSISYKIHNYLKPSAQVRNIQYNDKFKSRIGLSNKAVFSQKKIKYGIKTKLQKDFLNNKTPENLVIRNKFSIEYKFLDFFEPYLSYELFHELINNNLNFEKYRVSIGTKYDISTISSLKLFYCYSGNFDKDDFEIINIIGTNYEISF
ncbi:MAG: hypothetical protein CMF96_06685 [Candidatus Marinimicrobia bacterium]|nr:hypothetical protein [Candidatus Neomarinimicrobiota bacterium]